MRGRDTQIEEENVERSEGVQSEGGGSPAFPQCQSAGSTPSGSILKHRPALPTPI